MRQLMIGGVCTIKEVKYCTHVRIHYYKETCLRHLCRKATSSEEVMARLTDSLPPCVVISTYEILKGY